MNINRGRLREADAIARQIPEVLRRRGLTPAFQDWPLTEHNGLTWLFGVLDVQRVERLERYTDSALLHHISTALGGRPVYLSNSSGLRYAILLSKPPRLPKSIDFPGVQRGVVQLGQRSTGGRVAIAWGNLNHMLVAGMTGAGKSNFLRLLAYQGLAEGYRLALADIDNATFPMLAHHPALLAPIAHSAESMLALTERALGECDNRAETYRQVPGFPDTLDEYNAQAVRAGANPLPRLLVILDEFNAAVIASGGARGTLAQTAAELSWRGRKFGVNLVFAAQDFSKTIVGRVRDQVHAAVCFRVRSAMTARAVGCESAARISPDRPGLAVTDRWGPLQAYYLDKALLIQEGRDRVASAITDQEKRMVQWSCEVNCGYLTLTAIRDQLGCGPRDARRIAEDWELRGWLAKDPARGNARQVTDKLTGLIGEK